MKKILSVILVLTVVLTIIPIGSLMSSAAYPNSQAAFDSKISSAKNTYEGKRYGTWSSDKGDGVFGYQCYGYALWLSEYVWGSSAKSGRNNKVNSGWSVTRATNTRSNVDNIKPGDVVRYRNSSCDHSIFITGISGDTIYFTDCNSDGRNTVKFNRSISKSSLSSKLVQPLKNGGDLPGDGSYAYYGYFWHYANNKYPWTTNSGKVVNTVSSYSTNFYLKAANYVNAYSGVNGSKVGRIYTGDRIQVTRIYSASGWAECKCPWSNGTIKTVYFKINELKFKCTKYINAYGDANATNYVGRAYTNDICTLKSINSKTLYCVCPWGKTTKNIYLRLSDMK